MGLLDWLSDAIGGVGNAATDPSTMGGMSSAGTPSVSMPGGAQPPMPPVQQPGADAGATPPAPPMPPQGPDSPQNPTGGAIPMPMGRPQGANSAPPGLTPPAPSAVPPVPIVPPGGGADAAGAMRSYQAAGGTMEPPATAPGNAPQANSFLGRALGLDPNKDRSMMGGLAASLTAAGNSAGKSKFQAFSGGAGAALEGSNKADDKTTADQQKYLTQAIAAMKAGDDREANKALTQLRMAQTQMTLQGKMGKDSVMNSDAQLYLRAVGAANADGPLKLMKKAYDDAVAVSGASSPGAQAAKKAYDDAYQSTLDGHLGRLGLDPKTADKIGKQPGMSRDNPIPKGKMSSQTDFDKLHPGMYFVNPRDGEVLMKPMKGVGGAAAALGPDGQQPAGAPAPGGQTLPAGQGGTPTAQPASSLPPMPPPTPQASSIPELGADEDADEKEPA